jgi:hypothetical protein
MENIIIDLPAGLTMSLRNWNEFNGVEEFEKQYGLKFISMSNKFGQCKFVIFDHEKFLLFKLKYGKEIEEAFERVRSY